MNEPIEIKAKEVVKTYTTKYLRLNIFDIVINTKADIFYEILTERHEKIESGHYRLEGEEYKAWSNDDHYIVDLLCRKLGLTTVDPPYLAI